MKEHEDTHVTVAVKYKLGGANTFTLMKHTLKGILMNDANTIMMDVLLR